MKTTETKTDYIKKLSMAADKFDSVESVTTSEVLSKAFATQGFHFLDNILCQRFNGQLYILKQFSKEGDSFSQQY